MHLPMQKSSSDAVNSEGCLTGLLGALKAKPDESIWFVIRADLSIVTGQAHLVVALLAVHSLAVLASRQPEPSRA